MGRSWEPKEPRCAENPPSQEAEGSHEYSETREILRRETITVAGREIDTLVIREVVDASFEGEAASGRQHSETLKWFSPELRLIVRTRSEVSGETDGGTFGVHTFDITVTSEIQNLEPS